MKRFGLMAMTVLALVGCKESGSDNSSLDYLFVQMSDGDNWSIIDKNGKVVVEEEYPSDALFSSINDGVFWVKQDDVWQLFSIDQAKQPIIDEEFEWATNFRCGRAVVSNPNEPIRIIDTKGKTVAQLGKEVRICYPFNSAGYAKFMTQGNKYGIIDRSGRTVLKAVYDEVEEINDNYVIVRRGKDDKKLQIIDFKGKQLGEIDTEKYTVPCASLDGKILVNDHDGIVVVLDKTGKRLFNIKKSSWNFSDRYVDGYFVFKNSDNKYGVADEEGEIVIRTKYAVIWNMGHGEFLVKKGDKWGVVDAQDETILDFDYTDISPYKVGSYYLVQDGGSTWLLVGRDGKSVSEFDDYRYGSANEIALFVDVDALATALVERIGVFEKPMTVAELAGKVNLSLDDFHYSSTVSFDQNINDGALDGSIMLTYDGVLAEEKTHTETVDDGWFTTEQVISDGYGWSSAMPKSAYGTLTLNSNLGVDMSTLWKAVTSQMAQGRTMEADGVYSKTVKFGGQAMKCRTELGWNDSDFTIDITFSSN